MDTIIFLGGGLLFVLLGFFLRKKHQDFMSKCITVNGVITDIVEKINITRNSLGGVEDRKVVHTPIVQYKYNKLYEFQSEIDANSHYLKKSANVEVLIDPLKPKVAKLLLGANENTLFFKIIIGIGSFLSIIGTALFNPNDFSLDFIADPVMLLIITAVLGFLYFKALPIITMISMADIYTENAKEVED